MNRIVLAEDDLRLADLVKAYLESNDFEVELVSHGLDVSRRVSEYDPDLLILDIMLPGKDGLSICRDVRQFYRGPILILTARDDDIDQILGLEYGADDYVIKPAEPRVLLARIQALLRRCQNSSQAQSRIAYGQFVICANSRQVHVGGEPLSLSSHDFDLLWILASHPGEILSREELFAKIYNRPYDGLDRSIDVRVSVLRKKLADDAEQPRIIKTIWGKGYIFVAEAWQP